MHILVIPSGYPTEDAPIRGIFFKEQAMALKKASYNVGVIYSETRRITKVNVENLKNFHFQITDKVEDGVNTIRLKGWNILMMRNSLGINLWIRQTVGLFDKYIKKYGKPDIIHVHCGLYGGGAAKIIKEKYGIPYVITEHSSQVLNRKLDKFHEKTLREAYNNADSLISVGEKLKKSMGNYTDAKIEVIPNIVNTDRFFVKNKENNDKFKFLSISNLIKSKNVNLTIEAFSKNFKGNEKFELHIVGEGNEKDNLINLAKELGVFNQVKFYGRVDRENLPDLIQSCDCFVLPSEFETFGVVYIEALACGLPVIATKCGGPEDFVSHDLGYMIEVNDTYALEEVMKKAPNEISKFNKEEMSNYIKNKFSEKVVIDQITELFLNIIKKDK